MLSKKSNKLSGNKTRKSYKRIKSKITKSPLISKKTKTHKHLNKLSRKKSKISKKRTKKTHLKNIMGGGENIKTINQTSEKTGIMYVDNIDETNITYIGIERKIAISENPIATNGIATCMGIGMHIDDINYFEHIPECSNVNAGKSWNELITEKYTGTKLNMYVFISKQTIPDSKENFFKNITKDKVNIIIVDWTFYINNVKLPSYFQSNFPDYYLKVGMNKVPFGFYEVEYKEQKRLEEDERKRRLEELFLNKIVKLKNTTPTTEKMRWRIDHFHKDSGNPICKLVIDSEGNDTKCSKIDIIMVLNDLEITELV